MDELTRVPCKQEVAVFQHPFYFFKLLKRRKQ